MMMISDLSASLVSSIRQPLVLDFRLFACMSRVTLARLLLLLLSATAHPQSRSRVHVPVSQFEMQ